MSIATAPPTFRMRNNFDEDMWRCVVEHNEYGLPESFTQDDVILDVGAHIGCFSVAALMRGAGTVIAYECEPENAAVLRENLAPYGDRASMREVAVWRSDENVDELQYQPSSDPNNTGGGSVVNGLGITVKVRPFDDCVAYALEFGKRIRLLKLDCEGSEWPILYTSKQLDAIDEIVGEYHLRDSWAPSFEGARFNVEALSRYLESKGFVFSSRSTSTYLGIFHAQRG